MTRGVVLPSIVLKMPCCLFGSWISYAVFTITRRWPEWLECLSPTYFPEGSRSKWPPNYIEKQLKWTCWCHLKGPKAKTKNSKAPLSWNQLQATTNALLPHSTSHLYIHPLWWPTTCATPHSSPKKSPANWSRKTTQLLQKASFS